MSKLHIKKGDTVYVNAGEDKGKTGRVLKVLVKEGRRHRPPAPSARPQRRCASRTGRRAAG